MRATLGMTIGVGLCAVLICAFALIGIGDIVGEVERMRLETVEYVEAGDSVAARERLTQLANHWHAHTGLLEVISAHDDVHEAASAILDAQVCLEMNDLDDLLRVLEQLGMALEHIYSIQQVNYSNLY